MSLSPILALCEEGQININSASLEELDKLTGIGEVKSQAIINSRPFHSVKELINVYGIGKVTLANIEEQGLACVDEETKEEEKLPAEVEIFEEELKKEETKEVETIELTTKTIKSEDNKQDNSKYAVYGLVAFCVLLGVLFVIKNKKYKNEFR